MTINKVIALNIDIEDWDKYLGCMANDYRDIWINDYDLRYSDRDYKGLLEACEELETLKALNDCAIDYIVLRADID